MESAETYHVPVLLHDSIDGLDIQPQGIYVDVTFGGGGHSREILARLGQGGHLYSFDQDADAERNIPRTEKNFTFVRSNFRYLKNWMRYYGVEKIDGLLADLGVSSHQFDVAERGFSTRFDGELDLRMDRRNGLMAKDLVNALDEEALARLLKLYGELMPRKVPESRPRSHHSEAATKRKEPMTEPEMEPIPPSTTISRIS